jgi:hypothetical protein
MPARTAIIHLLTKAGIFFGALLLVGVLLAAIPTHRVSPAQSSASQESQSRHPDVNSMPGMDMSAEDATEAGA